MSKQFRWFLIGLAIFLGLCAYSFLTTPRSVLLPAPAPSPAQSPPFPAGRVEAHDSGIPPSTKDGLEPTAFSEPQSLATLSPEQFRYELLSDKSYEDAGTAKVVWEILVPKNVTGTNLEDFMRIVYSQADSRKFTQHRRATVVDIKAYVTREHAESGMGQWVAWMTRSGSQTQPSLSCDKRQIEQLGKEPEERLGLPEETRKRIWQDAVHAEDRANREAGKQYPESDPRDHSAFMEAFEKREELKEQLINLYNDELAKKYGLTREQMESIMDEGLQKSWPFPRLAGE